MELNKIAAAFIKAKKAFSPALKARENSHFKNKYADLGACIDAVNDALLDNGIALYQETFEDATGVTVETVFLHESGEAIRSGKLHVPAAKQDPQGYGSALTYARRYSLMAACGIAPEDDDGNAASRPQRQEPKQAKLSALQIAEIERLAEQHGAKLPKILAWAQAKSFAEVDADLYEAIVSGIKQTNAKKEVAA